MNGPEELVSAELAAQAPLVSVLVLTYNHEAFIAECLHGALAQRAAFSFEIVVGEDCSTDKTRAICCELQAQHPDRIRLLLQRRNVGSLLNFKTVLDSCRGRYVALLEGDDVWTSADKLQTQVDLLEQHPEWTACFHNVNLIGDCSGGAEKLFFPKKDKAVFRQEDFVEKNFVPTCSCVFRNRGSGILPGWFYDVRSNPYADWILHAIHARFGDFGYIHEVMASHRRHAGGSWGSTFDGSLAGDVLRMQKRALAFERLESCMDSRHSRSLRRQRALAHYHISLAFRELGDWRSSRRSLWKAFRVDPFAGIPYVRSGLIAAVPMLRRGGAGARVQPSGLRKEGAVSGPESH